MSVTLDELIAKHDLNENEVKAQAQAITRAAAAPTQAAGIPYITAPLSSASPYNITNKSVQTNMTAAGQLHWYVLQIGAADANKDIMCFLSDIPSNCDYDLYISSNGVNFSGIPMAGNTTEEWVVTMPAGTYYIVVASDVHPASTNSCYTVYAGRRYWQKIMTIELPHKAWDVNGNLVDINPIWFGAELNSNGWFQRLPKREIGFNLDGIAYTKIPYGAVVHHHIGTTNQEYSSKLWDRSKFRSMADWNWGTLQSLGAFHHLRPANSAYAGTVTGMYRYSGDTKINETTANVVNRSKVFPVRQAYVLTAGWDGSMPGYYWETYYTIGSMTVWIEFEANWVNATHLFGSGAGITCQNK